jgi:hypothetical protein
VSTRGLRCESCATPNSAVATPGSRRSNTSGSVADWSKPGDTLVSADTETIEVSATSLLISSSPAPCGSAMERSAALPLRALPEKASVAPKLEGENTLPERNCVTRLPC